MPRRCPYLLLIMLLPPVLFSQVRSGYVPGTLVPVTSMHLVAPGTGWAGSHYVMFWTTSNGKQWTDITPGSPDDREIASVFFLNPATGWVLFSTWDQRADVARYDLARTNDSGKSWSVWPIKLPPHNPWDMFAPGGSITFINASQGWMSVPLTGSSAAHPGALLETRDGGRTWKWDHPRTFPGTVGLVLFLNARQGWLLSGAREALYATHDGARSWEALSLKAPPGLGASIYPTYELPVFEDAQRGSVAVTFSGPSDSKSALVLFRTADGGHTWRASSIVSDLPGTSVGEGFPNTLADKVWIAAVDDRKRLTSFKPVMHAETESFGPPLTAPISRLSFINANDGWILANDGHLQATHDAGMTWSDVTPRR